MLRNHEGHIREFHISLPVGKYKPAIYLGLYHPDAGTSGEFCINWQSEGLCLEVFGDALSSFLHFQDVVNALAKFHTNYPTLSDVVEILEACGIINKTSAQNNHVRQAPQDTTNGCSTVQLMDGPTRVQQLNINGQSFVDIAIRIPGKILLDA